MVTDDIQGVRGRAIDRATMELTAIDTIRTLAMDAVQKANSGHPGTPMALAPVGYTLWSHFLRYDPDDARLAQPRPLRAVGRPCLDAALRPAAPRRGRGVDRAGQPTGRPAVSLDDIEQFRQLGSVARAIPNTATPPASRPPPVRSGQGCGNSVGMAIAERWLAARFNRPGYRCSTTTSTRCAATAT